MDPRTVLCVPYPAGFPRPETVADLNTAAMWVTGECAENPPPESLQGYLVVCGDHSCSWYRGRYELHYSYHEPRRTIFYEATPEGIEVSAPFGDAYACTVVGTWARILAKLFRVRITPRPLDDRDAWKTPGWR